MFTPGIFRFVVVFDIFMFLLLRVIGVFSWVLVVLYFYFKSVIHAYLDVD